MNKDEMFAKLNDMNSNDKIELITKLVSELRGTEVVVLTDALKSIFNITDDMLTVSSGGSTKSAETSTSANTLFKLVGISFDEAKKLNVVRYLRPVLGLTLQEINTILGKITSGEEVELLKDKTEAEAQEFITQAANEGLVVKIK